MLKNANPKSKIQKVPKPIAKQIQPAVSAEDFGADGVTGSGGGFIYSARFSADSVSTSMAESGAFKLPRADSPWVFFGPEDPRSVRVG